MKASTNYCRPLWLTKSGVSEYIFFSGRTPQLPQHVSQYAFFRVPDGAEPVSFVGALVGEDNEEYGARCGRRALQLSKASPTTELHRARHALREATRWGER